jgi:tryptophan-rich sensory protein
MKPSFYRQPHILAAGLWLLVVILVGGLLTDFSPWYFALKQPDWKPPDWAFGIIWTSIFLCALFTWVIAWNKASTKKQKVILSVLFIVNGLLNLFWSVLYFKLHRPDWSLNESYLLWVSVLAIVLFTYSISRLASLFMMPYLIWVSLAILLNLGTVRLNGPFQ